LKQAEKLKIPEPSQSPEKKPRQSVIIKPVKKIKRKKPAADHLVGGRPKEEHMTLKYIRKEEARISKVRSSLDVQWWLYDSGVESVVNKKITSPTATMYSPTRDYSTEFTVPVTKKAYTWDEIEKLVPPMKETTVAPSSLGTQMILDKQTHPEVECAASKE
jgi:hypothetical protein